MMTEQRARDGRAGPVDWWQSRQSTGTGAVPVGSRGGNLAVARSGARWTQKRMADEHPLADLPEAGESRPRGWYEDQMLAWASKCHARSPHCRIAIAGGRRASPSELFAAVP